MASRKRDAYAVALEDIHTQYKAFGEKLDLSVELLRGEIGQLRGDLGDVRGEIGQLRGDLGDVRGEIGQLRGEVGQFRDEMRAGFRDVRADLVRLEKKVDTKVDEPQVEAIVGRMLARAGR